MPFNFREGIRRLAIAAGGLGAIAGAIGGSLVAIDAHASAAKTLLGEPVWVDYTVAAVLPFTGFLILWGLFASRFGFGRDSQISRRHRDKAKRLAGSGRANESALGSQWKLTSPITCRDGRNYLRNEIHFCDRGEKN